MLISSGASTASGDTHPPSPLAPSFTINAAQSQILRSDGEFAWGGAASTVFWCDPKEQIAAVFFTQLMPSSTFAVSKELRVLVNQAVVD